MAPKRVDIIQFAVIRTPKADKAKVEIIYEQFVSRPYAEHQMRQAALGILQLAANEGRVNEDNVNSCDILVPIKGPTLHGCIGCAVMRRVGKRWKIVGFGVLTPSGAFHRCAGPDLEKTLNTLETDLAKKAAKAAAAPVIPDPSPTTF